MRSTNSNRILAHGFFRSRRVVALFLSPTCARYLAMKHLRGPPPQTSSPRALNHSDKCRTLAFASSGTSGGGCCARVQHKYVGAKQKTQNGLALVRTAFCTHAAIGYAGFHIYFPYLINVFPDARHQL